MNKQESLVRLSEIKSQDQDIILTVLEVLGALQDQDIDSVIREYKKLLKGELVIAKVLTRVELSSGQKSELEKTIKEQHQDTEVIFSYRVDSNLRDSLRVEIGDKIFRYSI